MAQGIPARLTAAEGRKFAWTVGTAFLVFAGIAWWRGRVLPTEIMGALGGVLWLAGALVPTRLGPVQRAWMGLAHLLSRVTTPIFMGIVFFVVLMPVGLLMRALGRNPIRHRPVGGSYWMPRDEGRGTLTNQF